jgi:hypothetical protein
MTCGRARDGAADSGGALATTRTQSNFAGFLAQLPDRTHGRPTHDPRRTGGQWAQRKQRVERVYGITKSVTGLRQFFPRVLGKVPTQGTLVCLTWKLKRTAILRLQQSTNRLRPRFAPKIVSPLQQTALRRSQTGDRQGQVRQPVTASRDNRLLPKASS